MTDHAGSDTDKVRRIFALALLLTLGFAGVEALAGWWSGSLALLADAGHMVSDSVALALALLAVSMSQLSPRRRFSYGFRRAEVLASLGNTLIMLGLVAWLLIEAVARLRQPQPVMGAAVVAVAAIGLLLNLLVLSLLRRADQGALNTRGAMLHVIGDLMGSIAALSAGVVIWLTGWTPIDPLLTLLIAALISVSALRLLWQIAQVLMEATPAGTDIESVENALRSQAGVSNVHDLHIWTLAGDRLLLSAHLQLDADTDWAAMLPTLQHMLADQFGISHATLQAEPARYVSHLCASEDISPGRRPLDDHRH